ncbi:MAG: hypothetical protein ACREUB_04670 [Burkholderiales bacterium]
MNRLLIATATLALLTTAAMPSSLASEGIPGATVRSDSGKSAADRKARFEQWCNDNPEKCREAKAKAQQRREECKADPEKCRAEMQARAEERFRKADANGDGRLTREEARKGMPQVARDFDRIDANKDGMVTKEELEAARKKARADARKGKGT